MCILRLHSASPFQSYVSRWCIVVLAAGRFDCGIHSSTHGRPRSFWNPLHILVLTKSDLLSLRQCPRKLWLGRHRTDLLPEPNSTSDRRVIDGTKVGEKAREDLGDQLIWPPTHAEPIEAAERARDLILRALDKPAVEVPMVREDLFVRADAVVPIAGGYALRETKASTFPLKKDKVTPDVPKQHHLEDLAIQAWVMETSGLPFGRVELNLLDNQWRYAGNGEYAGLFRQLDVTPLISEFKAQVPVWLKGARETIAGAMPAVVTGRQCNEPYQCPFIAFCKTQQPPEPEHPIELLPDSAGKKLAQKLKETKGYTSILQPTAEEFTGKAAELYRRIQTAHRDGKPHLDTKVREIVSSLPYPRYYFDFEGIDLPVPRWAGVRPYEQIPFQWSCHVEHASREFTHTEFLDLTGEDPSLACIAAMRVAIDPADRGPIIVYNATYEIGRLKQLADRHPEHLQLVDGYIARVFDLLPLVKHHFYDPRMRGSFSIKRVLPVVANDLRYDELEEVQEGTGAQVAYMQSVFENSSPERLQQIGGRLRAYCRQDTWAMVEIAYFLAGQPRPVRPLE